MLLYWKDPADVTQTLRVDLTLVTWDWELLLVFIKSNINFHVRFHQMVPFYMTNTIYWYQLTIIESEKSKHTCTSKENPILNNAQNLPHTKQIGSPTFFFIKLI